MRRGGNPAGIRDDRGHTVEGGIQLRVPICGPAIPVATGNAGDSPLTFPLAIYPSSGNNFSLFQGGWEVSTLRQALFTNIQQEKSMKRFALPVFVLVSLVMTGCVNLSSNSAPLYQTAEVKQFSQAAGLGLSPEFVTCFNDSLHENLQTARLAEQMVAEGSKQRNINAANSVIIEGKITAFGQPGAFLVGGVATEVKVYRMSDHALLYTLTPRVPYNRSPRNTDAVIAKQTGGKTAFAIKRALAKPD